MLIGIYSISVEQARMCLEIEFIFVNQSLFTFNIEQEMNKLLDMNDRYLLANDLDGALS